MSDQQEQQSQPTPPTSQPISVDFEERGAAEWIGVGLNATHLALAAYSHFKPPKDPPPEPPSPPAPKIELPPGVDRD